MKHSQSSGSAAGRNPTSSATATTRAQETRLDSVEERPAGAEMDDWLSAPDCWRWCLFVSVFHDVQAARMDLTAL